ncbi:hypothetical protein AMECASPLE_014699 [Ameca splendens]|uniref:Uncharacterized protein n=1 Tax=Ameca splendens TaxID=208324 RepID=A0ABV0ZP57_9TELE
MTRRNGHIRTKTTTQVLGFISVRVVGLGGGGLLGSCIFVFSALSLVPLRLLLQAKSLEMIALIHVIHKPVKKICLHNFSSRKKQNFSTTEMMSALFLCENATSLSCDAPKCRSCCS